MNTLVLQSYRTEDVPRWMQCCMHSVRRWAEASGFTYRCLGDEFFELAPAWVRARCGTTQIFPVTDLARLYGLQGALAEDFDRVVWMDADVLVFNPDALCIDTRHGYAFCYEQVIAQGSDGPSLLPPGVNNAVMVFEQRHPMLGEYLQLVENTLRNCPSNGLTRTLLGPELLHRLGSSRPLACLRSIGLLNPFLMQEILRGDGPLLRLHRQACSVPLAAANLSHFYRHEANSVQRHALDALYEAGVDHLLNTQGAALSPTPPSQRANPQGHQLWQQAQTLLQQQQGHPALALLDRAEALGIRDPQLSEERFEAAALAFRQHGAWSMYDRVQRVLRQGILFQGRWLVGEATLASPLFTPAVQLQAAQAHARSVMSTLGTLPVLEVRPPGSRIRLGFLGCDFYEQATAYLLIGLIEALDRRRFEVVAYEHGTEPAPTPFRQRILNAFDRFVRIETLEDAQAAELIHADGIDILLSIKNPASSRLGLLARRPAALQVHYLYYPGTTGMPFFDYILADATIIPPELEHAYSEKVWRMSGCYQPNDPQRPQAQDSRRKDWGLPEQAVVLANFSQVYKYTPDMFDLWCRALHADTRRLLWLLVEEPAMQRFLRQEAQQRGIDADRLIFTGKMPTPLHLNRLRCADLILDTYPYGGHTLTSDALWAGTPVVSLCGATFASRVASSLLHAVGLEALVAYDEQQYLNIIEQCLHSHHDRSLRRHLDQHRHQHALFNATAYARHFEQAMHGMVRARWGSGTQDVASL